MAASPSSSTTSTANSGNGSYNNTVRAKQHIDDIRKRKFSIGEEHPNPLTEDLHNAVTNLSSELYSKDVHFLMELIQNAEDNEYLPGVEPTLEFVLTTTDITGVGAPATLLVFNNEVGFSMKNIDSLCSVGRSTKKGQRHQGFIGEKGIGFKSVFLVSVLPHIFSNGYQIKFSEVPNQDCGIGYIVPEWVVAKPTISDIHRVYGPGKVLPTTVIILPLKPEKVEAVEKKLSEIHPEVLLFLHKIKQLSVRENSGGSYSESSVSAISIFSETNQISSSSAGADSRLVHLSAREKADSTEAACRYYMWRQVFPVNSEFMVDARRDMKECVITLAFPFGPRLKRDISSVGIFAFMPTAMVTNFPFIVHADFILASSRENILLNSKWNLGILQNVASTFIAAFTTCMKSSSSTEFFSVAQVLDFLPVEESPYKELNKVRQSIKTMLQEKCVVPCETFLNEKMVFCKPSDVIRVLPEFTKILLRIKEHNGYLSGLSSMGKFLLHNSVDRKEYDEIWNFLGVSALSDCYEWYGKCIQAGRLMFKASTDEYVELLCFLVDKWKRLPLRTVNNIPLVKYISWNGETKVCSILQIRREKLKIHFVWKAQEHAWLSKWNLEMGCPDNMFFFPDDTLTALLETGRLHLLCQWLTSKTGMVLISVSKYCSELDCFLRIRDDPKLAISFTHFIYHSNLNNYLGLDDTSKILCSLPIVSGSGDVVLCTKTLMPKSGSQWVKLLDKDEACCFDKYVELGEVYAEAADFAGARTPERELLKFLKKHAKTGDLPDLLPQDAVLRVASTQLTNDKAILLLDWLRSLRTRKYELPVMFIESIRKGKWMKTYSGFKSPNKCFLSDGTEHPALLSMAKTLKVSSNIDEAYYMAQIRSYKDELLHIGVRIGSENMNRLTLYFNRGLASSNRGKNFPSWLLFFFRCLKKNNWPNEDLLKTAKEGKWLKTNQSCSTPVGTVFMTSEFTDAVLQITDLHVVDRKYYNGNLDSYVHELKLLGVLVDLEDVYKLMPNHLKFPSNFSTFTKESALLLLGCVRHLGEASIGLTQKIMWQPWIKTSSGFRSPPQSLLSAHEWTYFLDVVSLPIIDEAFYGNKIRSYEVELEAVGVVVDVDGAFTLFLEELESLLSSGSLSSAAVISLLKCVKSMRVTLPLKLINLKSCLSGKKWLKTSHGYKSARDSVLFDKKWETISQFVDLPLIDSSFYGVGIHSFKDELELLGAVVNLKGAAHFVATGLKLPNEPTLITPAGAFLLLECARALREGTKSSNHSVFDLLVNKLRGSKWLKTCMGYRSPKESLIFNPDWECYLEQHDAPFIDQSFYGTLGSQEKDDLKVLGLKANTEEVCSLIFKNLIFHTQTSSIMRIYRFLKKFNWTPKSMNKIRLWIPDQLSTGGGKWVDSQVCVLHQMDNIFGSRQYALEKYYDDELLPFFSVAFKVAEFPSMDDYMKLWSDWVNVKRLLSAADCRSFWRYISENWDFVTKWSLETKMTMLPATRTSGEIQLVGKKEVFIPDDLQLKNLFTKASGKPLFVWLPEKSSLSPTLNKMLAIYTSLGVEKISESVKVNPSYTLSVDSELQKMDTKDHLIGKSLVKIVLAFLANNLVSTPMDDRYKMAKSLLDLAVFETDILIKDSYSLQLPLQKKKLDVELRRKVVWQKDPNRLVVQKSSLKNPKNNIEFVNTFAREISEGLLPDRCDLADSLCKVIQMGFAFGFKEDAVDYLLISENLELPAEDEEFLSQEFLGVKRSPPVLVKRRLFSLESSSAPVTPPCKRPR